MNKKNKDVRITIRLTADEAKFISSKIRKTPLTQSEFLRRLIFSEVDRIRTHEEYALLRFMALGMSQANNNINQIARALNGILKSSGTDFRIGSEQRKNIDDIKLILEEWRMFCEKISK